MRRAILIAAVAAGAALLGSADGVVLLESLLTSCSGVTRVP